MTGAHMEADDMKLKQFITLKVRRLPKVTAPCATPRPLASSLATRAMWAPTGVGGYKTAGS